ncbi:hypothetical protein BKA62DRAFT_675793 [Auriculariales sp. MPI-PUGE-AT-0066]|nr:hypothetical protein BKA62DRAFT_675793 [Auriculariales sp. MPI-PUGE-AT-0066]
MLGARVNICFDSGVTAQGEANCSSTALMKASSATDLTSSLAICTVAAVDGSKVLMAVTEQFPRVLRQVGSADPAFFCGLVLLINLFGFRSSLNEQEILRYMSLVHICLQALEVVPVNHPMAKQRRPSFFSLQTTNTFNDSLAGESDSSYLSKLGLALPEQPAFVYTNDPALSQQAQGVEQQPDNPFLRTPSPFCLEAIPIELQNQMTSGLHLPSSSCGTSLSLVATSFVTPHFSAPDIMSYGQCTQPVYAESVVGARSCILGASGQLVHVSTWLYGQAMPTIPATVQIFSVYVRPGCPAAPRETN